jgi:16S rRNA (guanine966-N2)-methyltransferase
MSRIRIIGGNWGGRTLRALAGEVTRPTTDRVREAWASTVGSLLTDGFEQLRVLDAFAGSGALGLEALSRGASHTVFCERDRRALVTLKANCDALGATGGMATVLAVDTFTPQALRPLREVGPYDLVILDPPYACAAGRLKALLRSLALTGSLAAGALVTYERARDAEAGLDGSVLCAACSPASLQMVSCKTYGTTCVEYLFYR